MASLAATDGLLPTITGAKRPWEGGPSGQRRARAGTIGLVQAQGRPDPGGQQGAPGRLDTGKRIVGLPWPPREDAAFAMENTQDGSPTGGARLCLLENGNG